MALTTTKVLTCSLCQKKSDSFALEKAIVKSNVRQWSHLNFEIWRCPECQSIHLAGEHDLGFYYQAYPFAKRKLDFLTKLSFRNYFKSLNLAGLTGTSRILDYGCGSGILIDYLKGQGFVNVEGYDPYSVQYKDTRLLQDKYDLVIAQDVIEHDQDPQALLKLLSGLLADSGQLVIGTPCADGISLKNGTSNDTHAIHAPFHLHLLSQKQIKQMSMHVGLQVIEFVLRHPMDTRFPFLNWNFLKTYLSLLDDTIDSGFEPIQVSPFFRSFKIWKMAFFGFWLKKPDQDMRLVLRKGQA